MLVDACDLSPDQELRADVCVVGSGPAGLTLARSLAQNGVRVLILESGGRESEMATQILADGRTQGERYFPLIQTRSRRLGGTAHLWDSQVSPSVLGFRCGPLDRIDFEARDDFPEHGWPFTRDELDPYYQQAQRVCRLGDFCYDGKSWTDAGPELACDPAVVETTVWQFATQRLFISEYVQDAIRSPHITVCLHANVVAIETDADAGAVTGVRFATLSGQRFIARADRYVLAAGGIENARLLLVSNARQPEGLGNEHDLVGRFFMEHPMLHSGTFFPSRAGGLAALRLYDQRTTREVTIMAKLGLAPEVLRKERLPNSAFMFVPKHGRFHPSAWRSLRTLALEASRLRRPRGLQNHLGNIATGWDFIALELLRKATRRPGLLGHVAAAQGIVTGYGWAEDARSAERFHAFDAFLTIEQTPIRENRIALAEERDALGLPRAVLHWQLDPFTIRSAMRTAELISAELKRSGAGRLRVEHQGDRPYVFYPGLHHHLGTTRMHGDPRKGVVDADSRVHSVRNLFITGGSVFTTSGYINPTLTVVALALRLGGHLAQLHHSDQSPARVAAEPR